MSSIFYNNLWKSGHHTSHVSAFFRRKKLTHGTCITTDQITFGCHRFRWALIFIILGSLKIYRVGIIKLYGENMHRYSMIKFGFEKDVGDGSYYYKRCCIAIGTDEIVTFIKMNYWSHTCCCCIIHELTKWIILNEKLKPESLPHVSASNGFQPSSYVGWYLKLIWHQWINKFQTNQNCFNRRINDSNVCCRSIPREHISTSE